jgi:kynurenine 3-monooxygenase
MMALMLARRGFYVDLIEKRPDFRLAERRVDVDAAFGQAADSLKRSINLALSCRGQEALRAVGLLETVMAGIVPMPARGVHDLAGNIALQPYGKPGQFICSASRSLLNRVLLDACDSLPNVRCFFETSLKSLNGANRMELVSERDGATRVATPRLIIGSDGAYSSVRTAMLRYSRMDFSRAYIDHAYKELTIPPVAGDWAMAQPNALHIWPRHAFMMIALPNPDRSFTCTLFVPYRVIDALDADARARAAPGAAKPAEGVSAARAFFQTHFPDALPLIPEFEAQFLNNPTSACCVRGRGAWPCARARLCRPPASHGGLREGERHSGAARGNTLH